MATGGHRTDENAWVSCVILHPDPVTQDRPTRKGGRGVDCQYSNLEFK
jgi:hypothetical protein